MSFKALSEAVPGTHCKWRYVCMPMWRNLTPSLSLGACTVEAIIGDTDSSWC